MAIEPNIIPFTNEPPEESMEFEFPSPEQGMTPPMMSHRDNLADVFSEMELQQIADDLMELYRSDAESRREWIDTYKEGLDYLGFSMEDRAAPFKGASGVYHPVLSEAVVRFQSNAIMEIFPASGPVMTKVLGEETPDKMKQALRIKEELNYQLTENMCEYRNETEQLLFRLPLAGSVFKKVYFDPIRKRPTAIMVTAEDFVVDYYSSEISTSERFTHVMRRSYNEIRKLQRAGLYRQVAITETAPTIPEGREKEDEITGTEAPVNSDTRHTLLEIHVNYNLPPPFDDPDEIADPYIITIDKETSTVLSIYRNWVEDDPDRNAETYFIHYQYLPGLGFYGIGLIHLLGSIAKASTSILRQLLDAGTLSNLPGGLKTRGLRVGRGEDEPIQPGEWRDVDTPAGAIRDNLFPLPYKEPSAVLANLLTLIVEEGRRIGSIADVQIGPTSANAPVGTTIAILERSLKVMTAVHARLHASLRKELKQIAKIIADYMPPQYDWDIEQQFNRQQDFDGRVDVLPVSDPNAATQAQKIVQMQAVQQLAAQNPELYNMKELHRAALQAIGLKGDERYLPLDEPPPRLDPVQENMAFITQQPTKVYQEQDHTAHIQVHLSWISDPKTQELVGQSPNAHLLQGAVEAHIAEHLAFQYRNEIEQEIGKPLPPMGEQLPPEVEQSLSRMVASASVKLREQHEAQAIRSKSEELWKLPENVIKLRDLAIKEAALEHKRELDSTKTAVDIAKTASKEQIDLREIESREAMAGAEIGANLVTFGANLESQERREGVRLGKEITENIRDFQQKEAEMWKDADERERDRKAKLEEARIKKPKPSGD